MLGTKILLDRKPYVVIGVMPRNFEFPLVPGHLNRSELWIPMSFTQQELTTGAEAWNSRMVGRLRTGITPAQAESDAERVAQERMRNYPAFMASMHIHAVVRSLQKETVEQAGQLVRTLFLAVIVVLLIACANLAGLLLVRAIRRRREIAVRLALGARSGTLVRQAILESLGLSVTGSVLGLVLAAIALRVGVSRLPETLPRINEISLDWQVVWFAIILAVLTGVVCGLAPAFAALRTSVNETLKEGGRTGTAGAATRGCAPPWSLAKSLSRWCCSSLPVCCCGVLRRCEPSTSAFAPIIFLLRPTRCRRNSTQPKRQWTNSMTN